MEEQYFKITVSGDLNPVAGCERLTELEVQQWMADNQVWYDEPNENQDLVKYIVMPLDNE